jgi:hypothetical protein
MRRARILLGVTLIATCAPVLRADPATDAIQVRNSRALPAELPCERVPLGEVDDYKPCIVRLADGTLLVVAFHQHKLEGSAVREDMLLFRSTDGAQSWSAGEFLDLRGREPYFSQASDGTLFITTHLLEQDARNADGYVHAYLHRSTDAGQSWTSRKIVAEDLLGSPPRAWVFTSRNVLELADGTLVFGVSTPGGIDYLWRSADKGQTWDASQRCQFQGVDGAKLWWPFFGETFLWQPKNGDLLGLWRVDHRVFPVAGTEAPDQDSDQYERLIVFRSRNQGSDWTLDPELGADYGEMYPSILRLADGRLLLTFTVRSLRPPLGVQAVLGQGLDDGFPFDFQSDRLVLDAKTPESAPSGGGFGPTVQLDDGTLVTAYSYRDAEDHTHLETVRWRLP